MKLVYALFVCLATLGVGAEIASPNIVLVDLGEVQI